MCHSGALPKRKTTGFAMSDTNQIKMKRLKFEQWFIDALEEHRRILADVICEHGGSEAVPDLVKERRARLLPIGRSTLDHLNRALDVGGYTQKMVYAALHRLDAAVDEVAPELSCRNKCKYISCRDGCMSSFKGMFNQSDDEALDRMNSCLTPN